MFHDDEDVDEKIKRAKWRMERLIKGVCGEGFSPTSSDKTWSPAVDMYETDGHLVILADIAGLDKEDIKITVDSENVIKIYGRRPDLPPAPKTYLHRMEISFGDFERSIQLPVSIDRDNVTASYRDGFLQIMIPKKATEPYARQIEVFSEE